MQIQEDHQSYYIYILTNKARTVLYVGFTNNLKLRLQKHKQSVDAGDSSFASRYNARFLLYFEEFSRTQEAIAREKEIKKWRRSKKIDLIKTTNPDFSFLNDQFEISPSSKYPTN